MIKAVAVLLFSVVISGVAVAQDSSMIPVAPFVAKLPAEVSWKMEFTSATSGTSSSGASSQTPSAVKKQLIVTRSGDARREVTTWSDGTTTNIWVFKGAAFVKEPKMNHYAAFMPQDNPYGRDYPDFPDLDWVDLNHFTGIQVKNGETCFVYSVDQASAHFPYKSPFPGASALNFGAVTVWIGTKTKLPVAWQDSSSTASYTFDLPVADLVLPAECQRVIDSIDLYEKNIAGKKMMLPR